MTHLRPSDISDISHTVAARYVKRGVKSYPYDDMFQDAARTVLYAATKWRANGGCDLKAYCYIAAERDAPHKITRAIAPASARGRDHTRRLGQVSATSLDDVEHPTHDGVADEESRDTSRIVRRRCAEVLAGDGEAIAVLRVLCGAASPRDLVTPDFTIEKIRSALQRARRKLRKDSTLQEVANIT